MPWPRYQATGLSLGVCRAQPVRAAHPAASQMCRSWILREAEMLLEQLARSMQMSPAGPGHQTQHLGGFYVVVSIDPDQNQHVPGAIRQRRDSTFQVQRGSGIAPTVPIHGVLVSRGGQCCEARCTTAMSGEDGIDGNSMQPCPKGAARLEFRQGAPRRQKSLLGTVLRQLPAAGESQAQPVHRADMLAVYRLEGAASGVGGVGIQAGGRR